MSEPQASEASAAGAPAPARDAAALVSPLGGVLLSMETVQAAVELVTRLAAETIPGTAGAGVTLVDGRGRRSAAVSNALVEEVDALQYAFDSGPCLTVWSGREPVRIDDLAAESRWPRWTAAATALGVRAMLSVPVASAGTSVGAIKVYSRVPGAYDARSEHVLGLFAQQAAALLANMVALSDARRLSCQLTEALDSRDQVGQAKGILIARGAEDGDAAFALLVAASRRSHRTLQDVARCLVDSVRAPVAPPRPQAEVSRVRT